MGQNFALNMATHGFNVSVCNRSPEKVDATVARAKAEGDLPIKGFKDPKEFVDSLSKPRKVVLLVQAGKPVDATIGVLSEFMEVSSPPLSSLLVRIPMSRLLFELAMIDRCPSIIQHSTLNMYN